MPLDPSPESRRFARFLTRIPAFRYKIARKTGVRLSLLVGRLRKIVKNFTKAACRVERLKT
jgi:hypothetical protein